MLNIFATDSMGLPLFVYAIVFEIHTKNPDVPAQKQNLT